MSPNAPFEAEIGPRWLVIHSVSSTADRALGSPGDSARLRQTAAGHLCRLSQAPARPSPPGRREIPPAAAADPRSIAARNPCPPSH